jgi:hypothetical protein
VPKLVSRTVVKFLSEACQQIDRSPPKFRGRLAAPEPGTVWLVSRYLAGEDKIPGATPPLLGLRAEVLIPVPESSLQTAIEHLRARLQHQMGTLLGPLHLS